MTTMIEAGGTRALTTCAASVSRRRLPAIVGSEDEVSNDRRGHRSTRPGARHHPDIAGILGEHYGNSPSRSGPTSLLIGNATVEMLHGERLAERAMGTCVDPLSP